MSEIVLSNSTNHYNYSSMVNMNPGLVEKSVKDDDDATQQQQYSSYPAYNAFQSTMSIGYTNYHHNQTIGYFNQQPNSPESISSPCSPPTRTNNNIITTNTNNELITPLSSNNPTTARVKEMITRANSVPMEFYHTEFLEYSKETYEKKMESKRNKRKRPNNNMIQFVDKKQKLVVFDDSEAEAEAEEEEDELVVTDDIEIRRQIHILSEQKRRAQIKDGFDELRKHLPGCNNKKMSKAALLTRTVQQLQHLKGMQNELLSEVERLLQENEVLKKFQHGVLQRQAIDKMYTF